MSHHPDPPDVDIPMVSPTEFAVDSTLCDSCGGTTIHLMLREGDLSVDIAFELQGLWDRIPDSHCQGLCTSACGPVDGNREERRLLRERGIKLRNHIAVMMDIEVGLDVDMCPALVDGQCTVYDVRPTICRLWGAGPAIPCPWGCSPDEPLPIRDSAEILARSMGHFEPLPEDFPYPVHYPKIEPPA